MGRKHIKSCSVSLVIREMQNKATARYHFTSTKKARLGFLAVLHVTWDLSSLTQD